MNSIAEERAFDEDGEGATDEREPGAEVWVVTDLPGALAAAEAPGLKTL